MPEREDVMSRNQSVVPYSVAEAYDAVSYLSRLIWVPVRGWTYKSDRSLALTDKERRTHAERKIQIHTENVVGSADFSCTVIWGKPGTFWLAKSVQLEEAENITACLWDLWVDIAMEAENFQAFRDTMDKLINGARVAIFRLLASRCGNAEAGEILAVLPRQCILNKEVNGYSLHFSTGFGRSGWKEEENYDFFARFKNLPTKEQSKPTQFYQIEVC